MLMEIRLILAPTDFSEFSKQALRNALGLAQTFEAKLLLLNVVEPPPYPVEGIVPSNLGANLLDDLERRASDELAAVIPEAQGTKVDITDGSSSASRIAKLSRSRKRRRQI
jgi:nucleotide-binding universal stress UspA family protein